MVSAIIVEPAAYFSVQCGPAQALDVSVFSESFTGKYKYTVKRVVGKVGDALGEWTEKSDKNHGFQSVGSACRYDFRFTWSHPVASKDPKAVETETVKGVNVTIEYNSFEFVNFKLKRV
jgi:hypothetical protein